MIFFNDKICDIISNEYADARNTYFPNQDGYSYQIKGYIFCQLSKFNDDDYMLYLNIDDKFSEHTIKLVSDIDKHSEEILDIVRILKTRPEKQIVFDSVQNYLAYHEMEDIINRVSDHIKKYTLDFEFSIVNSFQHIRTDFYINKQRLFSIHKNKELYHISIVENSSREKIYAYNTSEDREISLQHILNGILNL